MTDDYKDKLFLGDCLDGMKEMPDKCVDVSFTSPPYNDTGLSTQSVAYGGNDEGTHKKYLSVETRKDWYEWMVEVIDELRRVSRKYVLFNVQALMNNKNDVYRLIGHYADWIHTILVWDKTPCQPTSTPHKISNKYEFVLVIKCDGVEGVDVTSRSYWNLINCRTNVGNPYVNVHRAVMSKNFSDEIIHEFTEKGDIVLDPFFGCGTTGVSCLEQGRHYVGFEIEKTYYDISEKRLDDTRKALASGYRPVRCNGLF